MNSNQSGFIHFLLLVIVVIILVGVGGYFGYRALYPPKTEDKQVASHQQPVVPNDGTDKWKTYRSEGGEFRIKYPEGWITDTCDDMTGVFLAPPDGVRVKCGSEKGAQIAFYASAVRPTTGEMEFEPDEYTDITSEHIVLNGIKGKKITGKTKEPVVGLPAQTLFVQYFFVTDKAAHIAAYVQAPMGEYSEDYLEDFESIVTKTWRFAAF